MTTGSRPSKALDQFNRSRDAYRNCPCQLCQLFPLYEVLQAVSHNSFLESESVSASKALIVFFATADGQQFLTDVFLLWSFVHRKRIHMPGSFCSITDGEEIKSQVFSFCKVCGFSELSKLPLSYSNKIALEQVSGYSAARKLSELCHLSDRLNSSMTPSDRIDLDQKIGELQTQLDLIGQRIKIHRQNELEDFESFALRYITASN
jgi:hypothetical protein